jgi:hypothetical protein
MYGPLRMKITTTATEEHRVTVFSYSKFSMESARASMNNTGLTDHTCSVSANPQNILLFHVTYRITLTKVFPCFFLSCKANARVYLTKTGHGPSS